MNCKNCFHENAPEEKVCINCGMPLSEDETSETTELETADVVDDVIEMEESETTDAIEDELIKDEIISEEEIISDTDVVDDFVESVVSEEKAPKKKSKISPFSGLIALIIIAIALWVSFNGVFAPKYELPVDRSKFAVTYIKDASLYQKPVSGSPVKLSESLSADESYFSGYSYTIKQSKNGKTIYFLEDFNQETFSGTLYVSYNGKDKIKIADNVVQGYVISENGKTVMYMVDVDIDSATGPLYYYTKGGQPQLIANNSLYQSYMISKNGKTLAFLDNVDKQTGLGECYVAKINSSPVKVDDAVATGVKISDKGEVVYLKNMNEETYTYDLCKASKSKAPQVIASGVTESYILGSSFSDKFTFLTVSEDQIYSYNIKSGRKAPSVIMEDLIGFFSVDVENENFLLAKMDRSSNSSTGNPDMYIKKKGKEAVKIAQNLATPQHAAASYDLKTIYYMNEYDQTTSTGTLHVRKQSLFGAKDEIIAQGVSSFTASKDGKVVVYATNMNPETGMAVFNAYSNGKTKTIGENIFSSTIKLSQNGKTVTYLSDINSETYTGTLCSMPTTGSSKAKTIDTDVYASFYSRSDKNAIYLKNINSEANTADLYIWKGRGKTEAVDTGITTILFE